MIDPNLLGAILIGCISFVVIRVGLYWLTDEGSKKRKQNEVKQE